MNIYSLTLFIIVLITSSILLISKVIIDMLTVYKQKTAAISIEDSMTALLLIINSEIEEYEKNIFKNNRPITNSNFENYYEDISKRVVESLSTTLMCQLQIYITEDTVYRYVSRKVRNYLTQKVIDNPL